MTTEKVNIGHNIIEVTYFQNPMFHTDWHRAEDMGLVYSHYSHQGPDYWDDSLVFVKPDDKEAYDKYREENTW